MSAPCRLLTQMSFILCGMKRPEHGVVSSFHSCTAASNGSIVLKVKHILKELDACGKETLIEAIVIEAIGRALHRDQTRNVRDVLCGHMVFAVSLVLTLMLHQADDPLLFWRERIAKLANRLFHLCGVGTSGVYGAHRIAGESPEDNGLGT